MDASRSASLIVPVAMMLSFASAAAPVQAQNVVKDGGFEQAAPGSTFGTDPSADGAAFDAFWTIQNNVGIDTSNKFVFAGTKSLLLTEDNSQLVDGVTQTLATPDHLYVLSFYANADGPNAFTVLFGGQAVPGSPSSFPQGGFPVGGAGANAAQFTFYSFFVTATAASTELTFQGSSDNTVELDNISVAPVPEASTLVSLSLLLCFGLGGLMLTAQKRKKAGVAA